MSKRPQFRYNPKTLRYERSRFSFWRAGVSVLAYTSFGLAFFIGLNLLQNILIETKLEKSLLAENKSLTEYKVVLASQLTESNTLLSELKTEEEQLHEKVFEAPAEIPAVQPKNENELLATNDELFNEQMKKIEGNFDLIRAKTKNKNNFFGDRLHVTKTDLPMMANLPSIAPVNNLSEYNLVSGFGTRINPFHKGNYHHDGLDIALPTGTEVLATGNGTVASFSNSNVEAGFGNYIEIDHGHGLVTRYAHLEKISVTWGQKIKQGQVIGLTGSSGGSVAPHLHYELIRYSKNIDPLTYSIESISPAQHQRLVVKSKMQNQSLD